MKDDVYVIDTDLEFKDDKMDSDQWSLKAISTTGLGVLGIVIMLAVYFFGGNKKSNDIRSQAASESQKIIQIQPTPTPVVTGKLECAGASAKNCDKVLVTDQGKLEIVADQIVKDEFKSLASGTQIQASGQIKIASSSGAKSSQGIGSVVITSYSGNMELISPIVILSPTPTLTPSITPTITPTPTISDPPNIKEIVDASPGNDGDFVTVVGFIVNANIGEEACFYLNQCDYSTFVVNNDPGIDRDTHYDLIVKARSSEKESDYIINDKIKFNAKVVVVNGEPTLEKQY